MKLKKPSRDSLSITFFNACPPEVADTIWRTTEHLMAWYFLNRYWQTDPIHNSLKEAVPR